MAERRRVIGIDLGGTNLSGGVVDEAGEIGRTARCPAGAHEGAAAVMERIIGLAGELLDEEVKAVGLGTPGVVDPGSGRIVSPVFNLPGWQGMEPGRCLQAVYGLPVFVGNDANLAALAESWKGAGRGERIVLILTLGTGIGGGIVIDGKVFTGATGYAAEFGSVAVEMHGRSAPLQVPGSLEQYASAQATARRAQELLAHKPRSRILELAGGEIGKVTAKEVCDAARQGDELAGRVLDEVAEALATGIGTLINVFNPSVVLLGGGMSQAGEVLVSRVERALAAGRAFGPIWAACRLRQAELGENAGVIGAAKLALDGIAAGEGD